MRTHHQPPVQDFPYAVVPDWQPTPWPRAIRAAIYFTGCGLGWTAVIAFVLLIRSAFS